MFEPLHSTVVAELVSAGRDLQIMTLQSRWLRLHLVHCSLPRYTGWPRASFGPPRLPEALTVFPSASWMTSGPVTVTLSTYWVVILNLNFATI